MLALLSTGALAALLGTLVSGHFVLAMLIVIVALIMVAEIVTGWARKVFQ